MAERGASFAEIGDQNNHLAGCMGLSGSPPFAHSHGERGRAV